MYDAWLLNIAAINAQRIIARAAVVARFADLAVVLSYIDLGSARGFIAVTYV
jgi:hypothetical protein